MAKTKTNLQLSLVAIIVVLFSVIVSGGRTKLQHYSTTKANEDNGICKSVVETQGYSCEEHKVTTKDGFILSLQRIPTGRSGAKKNSNNPPVLLQHGILSDARTWLKNSPDKSLGFILADNGYDVWLANVRGTNYSSGHTSLTPNDKEYWDWSWDELVSYDLPSMVGYIYGQTGQKLHYVGHSLGTLMAFGAFSRQDDEVLGMTRSAVLLSPIAYLGQMPSPLARAAAETFIAEALYWLGVREFSPGGGAASQLVTDICSHIDCSNLESVITGPNCCMNSSLDFPQEPTSTKNMIHLAQMIREGTIAMYDYGSGNGNNEHYGQPTPPQYNMASIPNDLPLYFSYGGKDLISDAKDVQTLIDTLSRHDPDKLVLQYIEEYAHLDFVSAYNAKQVVYDPLMAFFKLN